MGLLLQIDADATAPLASNRGWSDSLDWLKGLPKGEYQALRHLAAYGWEEDVPQVITDLGMALQEEEPEAEDVKTTAEGMLETLRAHSDAKVVSVTNGLGPE